MKSFSKSEQIVSVKNLNLVYQVDHYTNKSVKDLFVSLASSPIKALTSGAKYYHVLQDINFDIYKGDRVGLLGVNGAGKTSLCRCIAQMVVPNSGKVEVNGKTRAIFDTSIGIVPELTGRENAEVICSLLYPELNSKERQEVIEESLAFSELGEFLDVPYSKYSKGMQARLSLSIVSARGCDLLILDEVYDGADIFFREKVSGRVLNMIKNSGAVIFVSHSLEQVEEACNKVVILDRSKVIYNGDVSQGITIYKNLLRK